MFEQIVGYFHNSVSAHESERVSCPSQLSLQTLVHNRRSSRLHFLFPKYTSAFYEGILSVCLIWGSGLEAVSHAQMDACSVIHNAFFWSHTSHRSHHSHTRHWISIVSFNKLCMMLPHFILHEKYMWIKSSNMYFSVPNKTFRLGK